MKAMKRQFLPLLLMLTGMATFSGCSTDELPGTEPTDGTATPFTITVTDGGYASPDADPHTRAAENSHTTTFTAGDQIGVFTVKNSAIVNGINNLCLTAKDNNGTLVWQDSNGNAPLNIPNATYYAYYPYQQSLTSNLVPTATDAAGFFANVISNWTPATDQSTYAAYTAQDLMVAQGTVTDKSLSFSMTHQMALVVISLPGTKYVFNNSPAIPDYIINGITDTKFTGFTPYCMSYGTYRYLVKPFVSGKLSGSYTDSGTKAWSFSPSSVSAGNYKVFQVDGGAKEIHHTLQAGDFYMSDGSLVDKGATLTSERQAACIGIVYSTDVKRIGAAAEKALKEKGVTPHGLVMALTNASDGCQWGNWGTDENNGGSDGAPFKHNTDQLVKQYKNVNGYAETQWIIKTYGKNGNAALQNTYSAFYHASRYGTAEGGTAKYAAPDNTTGWFIPSMGQWWDILSNLGKINLSSYRSSTDSDTSIFGAGTTAVENMNTYLNKISSATQFKQGTYFWSSSEYSDNGACDVRFNSNGYLYLYGSRKDYSGRKVRCSFAF